MVLGLILYLWQEEIQVSGGLVWVWVWICAPAFLSRRKKRAYVSFNTHAPMSSSMIYDVNIVCIDVQVVFMCVLLVRAVNGDEVVWNEQEEARPEAKLLQALCLCILACVFFWCVYEYKYYAMYVASG